MTSTSRPITWIDETDPLGPPADATTATSLSATNLNDMQDGLVPWATFENHGAVGDGTTDDTAAINAAIATGLNISLKPGKTYIYRQRMVLSNPGQVIRGNGATIKRPAQVVTTTTSTITSGSTTSITVASATGLQVGDYIVIEKSNLYDTTPRQISSINGTTVTVSSAFQISSSGTTNVRTSCYSMRVSADNVKILDLVFDGNSANWSWSRWAVTGTIYVDTAANCTIARCHLKNQVGDAIETNNCTNLTVAFNNIDSCTGRGISLGGSGSDVGSSVIGNRLYNCETDANAYLSDGSGSNDGHGSINFSLGGKDCLVEGNYIDTGITGIGALGHADQSGAKVIGNTIRNMTTLAIDANMKSTTVPALNVTIADNKCFDSIAATFAANSAATNFPTGWNIHDNLFSETQLNVTCFRDSKIKDNTCVTTGTSLTLINISGSGGAAGVVDNLIVSGNIVKNGSRGILLTSTGITNCTVVGNHCTNQNLDGIKATGTGIRIIENFVASGAASDTSNYNAINMQSASMEATGNRVDLSGGTNGHGVVVNASTQICRRNVAKLGSNSAATPFYIAAGSSSRFEYNEWDAGSPTDSGTATIKRGNRHSNGLGSGTAVLVAGTVTVSTAEIGTGDNVILSVKTIGGTPGTLSLGTITNNTSFVINSSSGTDTSTVFWEIVH